MLAVGAYAFKYAGLDGDGVGEALRTLFWLAIIDLPLIYIVPQVIAVLARRASPHLLQGLPAAASRHNGYRECG